MEFVAMWLLAAAFYGCVEDTPSRERSARPETPITLVDPTDPKEATKVVPGAIQPPHATDSLPGNPGFGLTKPN
jgi:hypothetical protein